MADKLLSEITPADIEVARRRIEDALIEFRDLRVSMAHVGNGLVVRERDGKDSSMIRLSTADAIRIAIKAMLEATDA